MAMAMFTLFLAGIGGVSATSTPPPPLSEFIATQHFQPCYNVSTLPSLLDGAVQAARLGSTSFKFGLKQEIASMYPYNNEADPWPTQFSTMTDILSSSQVQRLLKNELKTNFTTYTLWAYRVGAPDSIFCALPPGDKLNAELVLEKAQMVTLTKALMELPLSEPTSFWLESWENDWATRCGNYGTEPPPVSVIAAYSAWLTARQEGVTEGRAAYCSARDGNMGQPGQAQARVDCSDSKAVVAASPIKVYLGCEVNLVTSCVTNTSCGNIVTAVLPHVALDYVSYSSYDSMRTPQLADTLDLIAHHHTRTPASPERAVFITEFGLAETTVNVTIVKQVVDNVLSIARAKDIGRVHYWQTINNEKLTTSSGGGTCKASDPPNFDPTTQNGFWTTKPDGSLSFVGQYLQDIIAGRKPMPTL